MHSKQQTDYMDGWLYLDSGAPETGPRRGETEISVE